MGIITDFFVAAPLEVATTPIHGFPIGSILFSKGIDTLALDILARLLTGSELKPLLTSVKPDRSALPYSETGELDQESVLTFLRQNYSEEELDEMTWGWGEGLEEHIHGMDSGELGQWVACMPTIDQFHPVFVEYAASCPSEQLRQVAAQWCVEWAKALEFPSIQEEDFFPFLQELSTLAQQALSESKPMYYYFCL